MLFGYEFLFGYEILTYTSNGVKINQNKLISENMEQLQLKNMRDGVELTEALPNLPIRWCRDFRPERASFTGTTPLIKILLSYEEVQFRILYS